MECGVAIRWLNEITRADAPSCGSKAANLGELMRLGMPVPPGFVVGSSYYTEHARNCGVVATLEPVIRAGDWAAAESTAFETLSSQPVTRRMRADLEAAVQDLGSPVFAARSSATSEDLPGASFAGQYRSVLNVRDGDELLHAVLSCWASVWSRRAIEYRQRQSIDHSSTSMAVIIQTMVSAEVSGVLFTVDPVAHRSDRLMIELTRGTGEALVSGTVAGARCLVDRGAMDVVHRDPAEWLPSDHQLVALSQMALRVEAHFGAPQDIEFAFREGTLSLLQARPITTLGNALPEPIDPLGTPRLFDRLMRPLVQERYAVAPRPLDNLVYVDLVGAAIQGLRRSGAVVTEEAEAAFRSEIWRQAYRFPPHRLTWRFLLSGWQLVGLLNTNWLSWWNRAPGPDLRRVTQIVDCSALEDGELLERADLLLGAWKEPLTRRMWAASAYRAEWVLKAVVFLAVGGKACDRVVAELLSGLEHPTLETNARLWALSRRVRESPGVRDAVRDLAPERLGTTAEGHAFLQAFNEFVEVYGHRESTCWYLSTPTWRADPTQVWRILRSLSEVDEDVADSNDALQRYVQTRDLVERRLRFVPGLRRGFRWLLRALRDLTVFRELSHFDLTRVLAALQDIASEWGRRLVEQGSLETADDVFLLTHDEVNDWLLGAPPDRATARDLLARRRATYQIVNARWQSEDHVRAADVTLKGIATSPGVATGKACVIRGVDEFERIRPGEILVCPYTTPAWTPLFTVAAGVVTETGGAASHAAIVAREYGVPAVMRIRGATRFASESPSLVVDGDRGTVSRIAPRPE
jgi:pyruvate,water dikinase